MAENVSGRELIAAVAGAQQCFDTRQSWINRAARRAGISFRAAKAVFYGEITDPEHRAARRLAAAAGMTARGEATELADKFDTIARGLHVQDQDFYRAHVLALGEVARILRSIPAPPDEQD